MSVMRRMLAVLACVAGPACAQEPVTLSIATVGNPDMLRMKALSEAYLAEHPEIRLDWVVLDEGTLRQRIGTELALGESRYDVLTLGTYEVPIWSARGWLRPLDDLPAAYGAEDLLPPIREALSFEDRLFAVPFYGESSMTIYRADLLAAAGLTLPEAPTWDDIRAAARALDDPEAGVHGICLRGKPGWGENIALLTAMANSLGARWFDEDWRPQFDGPEWRATLDLYLDLMALGPPAPETRGFNEVVALFRDGRCGMLIDATVAASALASMGVSPERLGHALAPDAGLGRRSGWLWAWALAVPASSDAIPEAREFVAWATSREYTALAAERDGWAAAPPGTRASLYTNPDYRAAAPFAEITLRSILAADPSDPAVEPVPYVGVQFVDIPEFQGLGNAVGEAFASVLTGVRTPEEALAVAQRIALQEMTAAGYFRP